MSGQSEDASAVRAPGEGKVNVSSATGGTATGALAHGAKPGSYLTIGVDNGSPSAAAMPIYWVTFGNNTKSAMAVPDPTSTSTNTRTFGPYQGQAHLKPGGEEPDMRVLVSGAGTFYVRYYQSSHGQA